VFGAEIVAENQQRKEHQGERSRTMGRHHFNPNKHQYQGREMPQTARMPMFEVRPTCEFMVHRADSRS
jgi:hypothetical protein